MYLHSQATTADGKEVTRRIAVCYGLDNRFDLRVEFLPAVKKPAASAQIARTGPTDKAAMLTAVRELSRQVDYLQELVGTTDRLSQINGLFQETMNIPHGSEAIRN